MGAEEVERIKKFFSELNITPEYIEHEPVITSEDAAKTRGFKLKQGIKALLFTNGNNEWVLVAIPADKKVDTKKVAEYFGWSKNKTRMATPEEVLEKTGCEIGAVPPFGHKELLPVLVDLGVYENEYNAFNIGLRTCSVKIKTDCMEKVFGRINAKEGLFSR
jgi:prolyl-tRNA editing enzyme YbaK/EbsC (Cys-tRNA(Pro) deacylase)